MDKLLFTPAMIDTFKACPIAYKAAFLNQPEGTKEFVEPGLLSKRFLLQALSEVHRGRITSVSQAQKFVGQHWPGAKLKSGDAVKAFLFVYKALNRYMSHIYQPEGARQVGIGVKVRARIPHEKIYLEDTMDLILWHPEQGILELVDFHINPLKPFNLQWPPAAILVKQFLGERLATRWPFEKLKLTFCRITPVEISTRSLELDKALYKIHWPELLKTITSMKEPVSIAAAKEHSCPRCNWIARCEIPHATEARPLLASVS